jgi:hypothetical protein
VRFPGGRRVVSNATFELEDGRIVRQHDVAVGDQPEATEESDR